MAQIHKTFSTEQVKDLFKRYMDKEIERAYIQELLGIKRSQFFSLLKEYRDNSATFSINYTRQSPKRLSPEVEENIIKELQIDKEAIENKNIPLKYYNYSYVKDRIAKVYKQSASLPTVIKFAKEHDYYIPRKEHKRVHDREVLTRYIGELIQHDASYLLWAPASKQKWCLITSLDDHSRYIPYGRFEEHESSWAHIQALQSVVVKEGCPYSYYIDCHSIFRYVRGRDQVHHKYNHKQVHSTTGEIPYLTYKDIFAFRTTRFVNQYCKVTIKNLSIRLKDVEPRQTVDIRVYPLDDSLIELRFWLKGKLIDTQRVKKRELGLSSFQL